MANAGVPGGFLPAVRLNLATYDTVGGVPHARPIIHVGTRACVSRGIARHAALQKLVHAHASPCRGPARLSAPRVDTVVLHPNIVRLCVAK